jgi:CRISPR-associated endonuclease Cas1
MKIMEDLNKITLKELNIPSNFSPSFVKAFELKKENKTRPLIIESEEDKKFTREILDRLYPYFEKCLNKNNFAFKENVSIFDAIKRTDELTKKYKYYIKTDIKDFFENIDHKILTKMLLNYLDDEVVKLLMLFFKNRKVDKDYYFHTKGVHQGSVISPFLSNIYLTPFDNFLQKRCEFVRFADDIVIFSNNPDGIIEKVEKYLKFFKLTLNKEKTYISNKSFVFLNIRFKKEGYALENEKFNALLSKLAKLDFSKDLANFVNTLKGYYFNVLSSKQKEILRDEFILRAAKAYLKGIEINDIDILEIKKTEIIKKSKELKVQKLEKEVDKILNKQLKIFSKEELNSIIYISSKGISLGLSKNKITLKKSGKILKTYPFNSIKKIIIASPNVLLSSNLIYKASLNGISIDFIYKNTPFAEIVSFNPKTHHLLYKQISILDTNKQFEIAKAFVTGKTKNQINYIKYLSKYHKHLKEDVLKLNSIKFKASNIQELLGYEGHIGVIYWNAIAKVLDFEIPGRITKNANDIFNVSLNYAYAILYSRVQHALIKSGLSIYVSYLHSFQDNKPTLVYDLIEEFRAFVVDRVIVSMFNRNEPLEVKNGVLTQKSKKLIVDNIFEKLSSFTFYKSQKIKIENIIQKQAFLLRNAIENNEKYKPFIGRY